MFDRSLPVADRIDLDEREQIAAAAERLAAVPAPIAPPVDRSADLVCGVTLDAADWRRLVNAVPAAPPLVDRVLKAIRQAAANETGSLTIWGSTVGWCALLSYLLDRRICCDLGGRITAAVANPRSTAPPAGRRSPRPRKRSRN